MSNQISGRVILKESGVGIPNLLVVIYSSLASAPTPSVAPSAAVFASGDRLGSVVTAADGSFALTYDDSDFKVINPEEKRPDLHASVIAPEEPGSATQSRVIFSSRDLRQNAGRREQYLIQIPAAALDKVGIPVPLDPSVAKEQPQTVVGNMKQAMDVHTAIAQGTMAIASQQVNAVRTSAQQMDALVESRIVESLTGVTAQQADQLNIVLPGADPEATTWKTVNRTIENVVNTSTMAGYVVLSESEAQQFREANGNYRDHIPAVEIEPYIFQAD